MTSKNHLVHLFDGHFDLGMHTTLDDANSKLDPEVLAISARITPTQAREFGRVWDLFTPRPTPFITDEFEILVRNYTNPVVNDGTSGAGLLWDSASTTDALPISSATIDRITIGDVLKFNDEIVVVKAVDRTGNTIDVYERGAGETSGAQHYSGSGGSGSTIKIVGNAHEEGKVQPEAMAEGTTKFTNYMQLVEEVVDLSKADTDQARKTGRTADTLRQEAVERVIRDLARTAIDGVSRAPAAGFPQMTRGLLQWLNLSGGIKTNVAGAFTEATLRTILNDVRVAGGSPSAIVMSVNKKVTFNAFTSADAVNQDVNDRAAGRIVERYLADGLGAIPVVVDLDFPDDTVAVVDTRKMIKGWKENDTLRFVEETNTNSREKKETLQGKFGLAVENVGQSHGLLTGLT